MKAAQINDASRRFRCVVGVVVAGEILPRPPACQKDFFDKLGGLRNQAAVFALQIFAKP